MNKKTYTSPRLKTVIVDEANMIAGSITGTSGVEGLEAGGNTNDNGITEAGAKANQGYSVWDDDWSN
ncbi:MAG: hypothetical protein K6A32_01535 [Bacteroidales bacterium]|nr:hypothetical protein [Bacteroidales bacterium]